MLFIQAHHTLRAVLEDGSGIPAENTKTTGQCAVLGQREYKSRKRQEVPYSNLGGCLLVGLEAALRLGCIIYNAASRKHLVQIHAVSLEIDICFQLM